MIIRRERTKVRLFTFISLKGRAKTKKRVHTHIRSVNVNGGAKGVKPDREGIFLCPPNSGQRPTRGCYLCPFLKIRRVDENVRYDRTVSIRRVYYARRDDVRFYIRESAKLWLTTHVRPIEMVNVTSRGNPRRNTPFYLDGFELRYDVFRRRSVRIYYTADNNTRARHRDVCLRGRLLPCEHRWGSAFCRDFVFRETTET